MRRAPQCLIFLLCLHSSVDAASIKFTPAGGQADTDNILDISGPADPLVFKIKVDTLGFDGGDLTALKYKVIFN